MRFLALADLHGTLPRLDAHLPGVDAVLLAGDLAPDVADLSRTESQAAWFDTIFHDWVAALAIPVYACYGNHDFAEMRRVPDNLRIGGDAVHDGVFLFSWALRYGPYRWMATEKEIARHLAKYKHLPDVWVLHSPPHMCCEFVNRRHAGVKAIRAAIEYHQPRVVVCGHIHEGERRGRIDGTRVYNVSVLDDKYRWVHEATLIEM